MNIKMKILALGFAVLLTACGGAEERKVKYMEKGKAYLAEKNYEKAKVEFKNVLQIDPKFAAAYYYMGQLEERNMDLQKAAGNYNQVLQLDPEHSDAKVKLAKIYTIVGTDEFLVKAIELLGEVKLTNPEHAEAAIIDAVIDIKQGRKEQAIVKLKKSIEGDALDVEAYSLLAGLYAGADKNAEAISVLEAGINKDPAQTVSLRIMLAQFLIKDSGNIQGAEMQLQKAIEIMPENYHYRVALSSLYSSNNQLDKAESVLRQAVADNKTDSTRYLVLVEFLATKKSVKAAGEEIQLAIDKNPKMYDLRFAQVHFYEKLNLIGKAIDALTWISKDQDLAPNGIRAKVQLADIYLSLGEFSKAKNITDIVLKEKGSDSSALLIRAKLAFQQLDDQTVINDLRTVLKDDPKNDEAALLLAQAHERNNESELAKETLVRTLENAPLNPKNHLNYANYLASKNSMKEAMQTIDKALSYFKTDYDLMDGKLRLLAVGKDESAVKAQLDQMKLVFPNKEEVFMQRGQYFVAKKQYDLALVEFESALKNSVAAFAPLEAIVHTYVLQKQEQKAIEFLKARLVKNSSDVMASQLLGKIYASQNDMPKAVEYFSAAAKDSKWALPYMSLANVYRVQNNIKEAQAILEKGVEQAENPVQIQLVLASLFENQKNFDKAISIYEKVLEVNPANQMAANNLASLLLDVRGDQASAKRALELSSGFAKTRHPALMDTLGWAALKTNDAAKAVSVLEEVVRMKPEIGVFQYHLGMAYMQSGDSVNAKRYLSLAVANTQNYLGKDKAKEALAKL